MSGLHLRNALLKAGQWRSLSVAIMSIAGIAVSLGIFATLRHREWQQVCADLTVAANVRMAAFATELDVDGDAVDAIHAFCSVHGHVDALDFHAFVAPFAAEAPGLRAFAWVTSTRDANKKERFAIRYAEPQDSTKAMVGVDLGRTDELRHAFERSRDSGKAVALTSIPLPAALKCHNSFVLIRPVYWEGMSPEVSPQPSNGFCGFVVGIFSIPDLVDAALKDLPPEGIHMDFYDLTHPDRPRLFHRHESRIGADFLPHVPSELIRTREFDLQVSDTNWRIECYPVPAFIAEHKTWNPWVVLGLGLMMTTSGCTLLELTIRRAVRHEGALMKQAEELRHSEKRTYFLLNDVKAKNRELEQLYQVAQTATRAKSEFLANMSHELRTPLTAIMGYADLLIESLPSGDELQAATTIERNAEHLLAIINDLLDISKIEAGRFRVERVSCSPEHLFVDLRTMMAASAHTKGLTLHLTPEGPLPETIVTDPVRLRQILVNLIGNAIKFTEHGEVRVTTRFLTEPPDDPKLQIEVTDTGIGMSSTHMERLFQPFVQADSSITRRFGGTGLGLTLSKRLAIMLGGDIAVHSTPGKGSTFTVTIATGPVDPSTLRDYTSDWKTDIQKLSAASVAVRLEGRILLAEDGVDNQRLLTRILTKAGAQVVVAQNGQEALDMALAATTGENGSPFGLILMDIQMPVMDGYHATRQLRAAGYKGTIVALTAHAMPHDIQQCRNAGCDSHIAKPFQRDALLQTVAQFLNAATDVVK